MTEDKKQERSTDISDADILSWAFPNSRPPMKLTRFQQEMLKKIERLKADGKPAKLYIRKGRYV